MRVTEVEDGDTGILGDLGVLRHLTSLVIRHAIPCGQRHVIQCCTEACYSRGGSCIAHLRKDQVAAFEFDEGADSRCVAYTTSPQVLSAGESTMLDGTRK